MRRLVQYATWRSKRSLLQPWRDGREWILRLECEHTEYRLMRYSGVAIGGTFPIEQALPPPRRVICHKCEGAKQ